MKTGMKGTIVLAALAVLAMAVPGTLHAQLDWGLGTLWATKCPVRINEVMINPRNDTRDEFIELYNTSATQWVDIAGWTVSDGGDTDLIVDYTGPYDIGLRGTSIPPRGYALIVDGDYNGVYNGWIADALDSADVDGTEAGNCIMVRVNDNAIGDGLNNTADSVRITTTWPLFRNSKFPRQTGSVSWSAADGFDIGTFRPSWEWSQSGWGLSDAEGVMCSPGAENSCEWL